MEREMFLFGCVVGFVLGCLVVAWRTVEMAKEKDLINGKWVKRE
jgi:hypothetical protein